MGVKILETQIVSAILQYLSARKVYAWRMNTGATKIGDRFIRFGHKGLSDIIGILEDGRFLAIEVKAAKGIISDDQALFLNGIIERGGVAFVARSIDDVQLVERNGWVVPDDFYDR